ncbi:MipA/OmpV family protein [Marinomonas aquiplantarum]|uniref:Outer membrane protein n=1 Tax=Marinomonas aquiplantarum TaxID=491951 RepID=A0A366CZG2_9GAMM|nr:MipA/OmpV family protein [Marinomonas aquiplantarum]RBO83202.1 outer membrane protein [Marinomonas aquiplantarum]
MNFYALKYSLISALIGLTLATTTVQAKGSIGVLGALSESIYRDMETDSRFIPNLSFKGERFYVTFPDVGYHLIPQTKMQALSAGLTYQTAGFDPDDSDNNDIQQLDDRDDSVMAFAKYRLGLFSTKVAQDMSGTHNGYYIRFAIGLPIPNGNWVFIPSISHQYTSRKMSQHLYGVSQAESDRTSGNIAAFNADATSVSSIGLRSIYKLTPNTNIMLAVKHNQYSDNVLDSPIVDQKRSNSIIAGIIYNF